MKFTKQQKLIIKKIASGDIKDITSFIKVFNLSTFYNLNKEDIEKRMKIDENGKTYKKLNDGVKTFYSTTSINNALGIPMPSFKPIIPKEEDFEEVTAIISYSGSYQINLNSNFFKELMSLILLLTLKIFLLFGNFLNQRA